MSYYHDAKNVENYLEMAEGYDGRALIEVLATYLPSGSTVLELGMGPGKDFALLSEHYQVTGSDSSALFVERYRELDAEADLVQLDAVTMDIDRHFDCIYSNKVLQHLTRDELRASLANQATVLNAGGILLHSLWIGEGEDVFHGLLNTYYTEGTLRDLIGDEYELVDFQIYDEMGEGDSFFVVMRKTEDK